MEIPSDMTSPVHGTMTMLTVDWADRGAIYIFSVLPLGIVTFLTVVTACYASVQGWKGRHDPYKRMRTPFDFTDMLQSITGTAQSKLASTLLSSEQGGLLINKKPKVRLAEDSQYGKRLEVARLEERQNATA
ncbi:hypothetical protein PAXRUDRAFT_214459 [Paxillus rubicundulus Ve08.2h10]|uniref:Uncharacterized protein n=1 Tax=Paxillus rubicundulus Ve08.2h10 TaxID=930991 RepID=A0A0D0DHA1_9AGAM|nr:hypothetical protein PAXRUDRAFT_214459 [Paxillus rubicundulus Ve08.2h10]